MLDRIQIVLVNPSHPGNIGSVARAMKTMGLNHLSLVEPHLFPHPKAEEMATHGKDILAHARIYSDLKEAIQDTSLIIGTSARERRIPWPLTGPRAMAEKISTLSEQTQIAILFGREQSGLTNDELALCHWHIQIPTADQFSSLNLAAAVQVIAYELLIAANKPAISASHALPPATALELENFFTHLEQVLQEIDFLKSEAPRKLMMRMRRLFMRATLDKMEVNMLRGMLTAMMQHREARR